MREPTTVLLRESVRHAVAASSLRAVAEQVGLTHRGLALFIEGSKPRPTTRRKLTAWFATRSLEAEAVSPEVAEAAIAVLLQWVPESIKDDARGSILALVRQMCEETGVTPPAWIDAMLANRR